MLIKIQAPIPERIPGGYASGRAPILVDPWQIAQGMRVEMEHTRDPRVAYEIAVDHLYESPDYYTRLAQMERSAGLGRIPAGGAWVVGALALAGALLGAGLAIYEWRGR